MSHILHMTTLVKVQLYLKNGITKCEHPQLLPCKLICTQGCTLLRVKLNMFKTKKRMFK